LSWQPRTMITVNFYLAVSVYLILFIGTLLLVWLLGAKERDKGLSVDERFIWFCEVCSYTYVNTREEHFSVCPRCGSYNKK